VTYNPVGDDSVGRTAAGDAAHAPAEPRVLAAFERRAGDLVATLGRHGIAVDVAPPMSTIPHPDDAELRHATERIVADPPGIVVVTTGVGFTAWLSAAAEFGLGKQLAGVLAGARIVSRGAKVTGAIRKAGLSAFWEAPNGLSEEVREYMLGLDLSGARVAVQFHGSGADGIDADLRAAGAVVTALVVYRWGPPHDPEALERSIREVAGGGYAAVLFTAAPGTAAWLAAAERLGLREAALRRFAGGTIAAAVGPVTAGPLVDAGVPVEVPERWRLGALARLVLARLGERGDAVPAESGESD